jgi:serine/threonine-protein kinase
MAELLARLQAALADRYALERQLGSGGMATVYLAEDRKHRRKVAVKVLRPEIAASLGPERFVREIEIAANLTHPHILPLFDSGEADGFLYYVMPYIAGESLRERLTREGKLAVPEAIRLTEQVASALSHAHAQGLVHRDIKPENILLAGDQAIVADFGIARAVEAAADERLTGTGFAVGTPAYMSPEQALGAGEVDARSDVYALGCVLYEMVAGTAPFEGATPQELIARHAADVVPGLRTTDPTIPLFVERAVERAMAKQPEERFPSAQAFAEVLTGEQVVARVGRRRRRQRARAVAVTGVVLLAAVAWGLATALGGPAYERLAVLPPANLMNDSAQAYFVQGVHNALIAELQRAGIPVIARTSVVQYEHTQKPIREIARELGVDALVEASVRRTADSVEIQASVVDGATQQYVGEPIVQRGALREVERLYRGLTSAIAAEIQVDLTPQVEARLASASTVNPAAYDAYLRGQVYLATLNPPDLQTALEYFELSLDIDPDYAPAHAGIAQVWAVRQQIGLVSPSEAAPQVRAALARALALDSTLAEVQGTLAVVRTWTDWDWAAAETAYRRSIEINPNAPGAQATYAHFLCMMARFDEAMEQIERAVELDPLNPLSHNFYGWVLYYVRRYDDAIAQFQHLLRMAPDHPGALVGLSLVYHAKGMYDESLAAARSYFSVMGFTQVEEALEAGYAEGGYRAARRHAGDTLAALRSVTYVLPTDIAMLYILAGENGRALEWLERGFEERDPYMAYLRGDPVFDPLRDEPRFQDLLRRMGLPH